MMRYRTFGPARPATAGGHQLEQQEVDEAAGVDAGGAPGVALAQGPGLPAPSWRGRFLKFQPADALPPFFHASPPLDAPV